VLKKVRRAISYNVIHSRDEYIWEYILWNPKILSTNVHMLEWGFFQKNIAENMRTWESFLNKPILEQCSALHGIKGG
jgi:hypothetical protein